ncbi:MAG: 16S rRNA processing protein RimM [Leptospiraceae bacterium]|nr:16S rRNA processing protein RimM [Leptospiraceae bacterium]
MINDFISLGKITSTHGLKGVMKVAHSGGVLSENQKIKFIYTKKGDSFLKWEIESFTPLPNTSLLKLKKIQTIEEAEELRGEIIYLPSSEFPESKEGFYQYQLIGLSPVEDNKVIKGFKVKSIMENPAHSIFVFSNGTQEIMVPYVDKYIGDIDIKNSTVEVFHWMDWFDEI